MKPIRILLLSDGRPGHYHLSEGVVAAIERLSPVVLERLELNARRLIPQRFLARHLNKGGDPARILRFGLGLSPKDLPPCDLVVSAGGDTLVANVAAARLLGAANIFCGTLRRFPPQDFTAVISSYERHSGLARHIVALKPNTMDADRLNRPATVPRFGASHPPANIALLVGGNSGLFRYQPDEWRRLVGFLHEVSADWGTRWLVSTSRRTDATASALFAETARDKRIVKQFVNYRMAGPGTLPQILRLADVVVCTADSSTMISEAVCARLPVIGVTPADHAFKPEEREYRDFMLANNWCRFLPINALTTESFGGALAEIEPLAGNHIEMLAEKLRDPLKHLIP